MKHGENMSEEKPEVEKSTIKGEEEEPTIFDGSLRFGQPIRMGENEEVLFWYLDHQFSEWVVSV